MPRKKTANGSPAVDVQQRPSSSSSASSPTSPERRPLGPLDIPVDPKDRDEVKVNNASMTELKNACDDALKKYLSRQGLFKQKHTHTDVKLALGWASVLVAGGTALYGYKVEFEQSKPVVWAGLITYCILSFLSTVYSYFIEGDVVFVGKRRNFAKRIETDRLTLSSSTIFPSPSYFSLPSRIFSPSPSSKSTPDVSTPSYSISFTYANTASSGRSLLAKGKATATKEYNAFFDEKGLMCQDIFENWVGELVQREIKGGSVQ